jgi:hypothetical protein
MITAHHTGVTVVQTRAVMALLPFLLIMIVIGFVVIIETFQAAEDWYWIEGKELQLSTDLHNPHPIGRPAIQLIISG